jgi:hypothetical protein
MINEDQFNSSLSHLEFFKQLVQLRENLSFYSAKCQPILANKNIYLFVEEINEYDIQFLLLFR